MKFRNLLRRRNSEDGTQESKSWRQGADQDSGDRGTVAALLDSLVGLACAQAPAGFTLPGLGKLKLVQRSAREGRNPATGEKIKIPAKKVLKFSVAKAAKDCVCGCKK